MIALRIESVIVVLHDSTVDLGMSLCYRERGDVVFCDMILIAEVLNLVL